jgi:hypothetical protein
VWAVGAEGDTCLHGHDGDTGAVVLAGGDAGDAMGSTSRSITPIVAKGRIFVAANGQLDARSPRTESPRSPPNARGHKLSRWSAFAPGMQDRQLHHRPQLQAFMKPAQDDSQGVQIIPRCDPARRLVQRAPKQLS